jgi:ketosteroid isomerase-like protein
LFALSVLCLDAETLSPAAHGIIDAERAFARMAKETNTRAAFLAYLTVDSITFGQGPHKGKAHILEKPAGDDLLEWEPAFVDVAASGDFGYDLGPWQFRRHRVDASPIAWGTFITIWKKQKDGKWKFVLDAGNQGLEPEK